MAERITPDEALDRVFQIIVEEIADKPAVKRRLLDALGVEVVFEGDDAVRAMDPILLATKGYETFRSTLIGFKAAQLKKVLQNVLLEPAELRGASASDIVDLAWTRALEKLDSIRARRMAAE